MSGWKSLEAALDALLHASPDNQMDMKEFVKRRVESVVKDAVDAAVAARDDEKRKLETRSALQREMLKSCHKAMRQIVDVMAELPRTCPTSAVLAIRPICSEWSDEYAALAAKWADEVRTQMPDGPYVPAGEA